MTEQQQKGFIKDNYLDMPIRHIAKAIGRSRCFVKGEMKRQGLVIPNEILMERAKLSRFKKGSVPFNKGLKMEDFLSTETIEKFKASQYKKGNRPHNTLQDFEIRVREDKNGYQYKWIRISMNNWVHYHRYLWEKENGSIPEGHNVQFIDGDTLNCVIENLYLVKRKNQIRHNCYGGKHLPHNLKKTVTLIHELKIKTNEKQDH